MIRETILRVLGNTMVANPANSSNIANAVRLFLPEAKKHSIRAAISTLVCQGKLVRKANGDGSTYALAISIFSSS